jgi:hypothetical protein
LALRPAKEVSMKISVLLNEVMYVSRSESLMASKWACATPAAPAPHYNVNFQLIEVKEVPFSLQ